MNNIVKYIKKAYRIIKEDGLVDFLYRLITSMIRKIKKRKPKRLDYLSSEVNSFSEKKNIYIITAFPYYSSGGGQRAAQLAKAFKSMNYKVNFFYAHISRESSDGYDTLPLDSHSFIDKNSIDYINKTAREEDIFIFESPLLIFQPILDIAVEKKCKIVYENIDNWETSLGEDVFFENVLVKMLKQSNVLVGTSKLLVKQIHDYCKKYNVDITEKKIMYLPNAVDQEIFCTLREYDRPLDLVIGEKTILYYGELTGEWFDWDLVMEFAKNNPNYKINLIGYKGGLNHVMKKCPDNVYFLGKKIQRELPAYLRFSDYAIIPFIPGDISDYVSPIKIFEYICMHSNILCTSLPDIKGYPNVHCGDTHEEWQNIIKENLPVDIDRANTFIKDNTWVSRASAIIKEIYY